LDVVLSLIVSFEACGESNMSKTQKFALSVTEAGVAAGVKKDSIYKAMNSGELPSMKIGRRRLIRSESLQAWLKAKEDQGQRPADTDLSSRV